jgi:hypothetical protein
MLLSLRPETRELIALLEAEAGVPVHLQAGEPHYPARSAISFHLADPSRLAIFYNPRTRSPDYAIAHEAARFLRFWRAPPEKRLVLGSSESQRAKAYQQMTDDIRHLPVAIRRLSAQAFPICYDGLLTQLVSTPGDFWINKQLHQDYVSFRGEIETGLSDIFRLAHQAMRPEIRAMTPRTVYRESNAMNAAFASFAGELLDRDDFHRPYRGTEFEALGQRLRQLNAMDRGYPGDREATDAWARELGVAGWYGWRR